MRGPVTTIKASADYQRIAKTGKRWSTPAFIIQFLKTTEDAPFRLGLTASRKVGDSVVRNRAKRRLREMVRKHAKSLRPGHDIVLIAKTDAAARDFAAMCADFEKAMTALGALA
jgi:ribonuclease P protein component